MTMNNSTLCQVADLADIKDEIVEIRHHIHQHPELSFEEVDTAALVAQRLEQWGFAVTRHIGGNGLVGTLQAGSGSRSIGLRADLAAWPILEETGLPYASSNHGAMHACGHAGHTAMLRAAARQLARTRNFDGT